MELHLRKELFWDIDSENLDEQKHKNLIIQRVLSFGTIEEFKAILNFYSEGQIKQAIRKAGYFDPKTFSFVIQFFNLDKNELLCYKKGRSNQRHWS